MGDDLLRKIVEDPVLKKAYGFRKLEIGVAQRFVDSVMADQIPFPDEVRSKVMAIVQKAQSPNVRLLDNEDVLTNSEKRKQFNVLKLEQLIDTVMKKCRENPSIKAYELDDPMARLSSPIEKEKFKDAEKRLEKLHEQYSGGTRDSANIYFRKTEQNGIPFGFQERKVYIAPPFDKLPEFLAALFPLLESQGVKYDNPKVHLQCGF